MGTPGRRAVRQGVGAQPRPGEVPGLPGVQGRLGEPQEGRRRVAARPPPRRPRTLSRETLTDSELPGLPPPPARRRPAPPGRSPRPTRTAPPGAPRPSCAPGRPRRSTRTSPTTPRDFLAVATPGAGKTTFALTVAAELLARRVVDRITVVAPTEHLKTQWAEAAARAGIPIDPTYSGARGQDQPGLRRRRGHLRRGGGQPAGAPDPHRAVQDPGDPRRGAPRRRRAVVGRGGARGVRAGAAAAGPDRHAVPLRHQPDPVRVLRARTATASAAASRTTPTATPRRWPTTSSARCCSWPTAARCSGAPAPATRSPPGSASR